MATWDTANPVFVDFETQSVADIKTVGGICYAEHPTTRILSLSVCVDSQFYLWVPDHVRGMPREVPAVQLWPSGLNPFQNVTYLRGSTLPSELADTVKGRTLVAHNAYGFDMHIWNRFLPYESDWLDSMYLARQTGRAGSLDALGKSLLGVGKDYAKKLLPKLTTAHYGKNSVVYPVFGVGEFLAFMRYAVADVELLRRLWAEFAEVEVESDAIEAHESVNNAGVRVDTVLADAIARVSVYAQAEAIKRIEKLTKRQLHADNLRSGKQVHAWLEGYGLRIVDENGKPCLRKEVIQKFIDSPYVLEHHLTAVTEVPPVVAEVLALRMNALRITDAKVTRAIARANPRTKRIYGIHSYHIAHTGRASSHGVQIHNLPRPKEGAAEVVERVLYSKRVSFREPDTAKLFDRIKSAIPEDSELTVDDICSALIRPMFRASRGKRFVLCDFSQVEARGVAWIAGETKALKAFAEGRDIYREFAAIMFGVPLHEVTKNQRQIAKSAILGCGYGLGSDKFRIYAANNRADLTAAGVTAEQCIDTYRDTYTKIAGFRPNPTQNFRVGGLWKDLNAACMEAVATRVPQHVAKCVFTMANRDLHIVLPSGRALYYPLARIEDVVPPYCYSMGLPLTPKATVVYTSAHGTKSLYGGLLAENIVQAICRDMLYHCMIELQRLGYVVVLHIHDELVLEVDKRLVTKALADVARVMSTPPDWAAGFPLACDGFESTRFTKQPYRGMRKTPNH